MIVTGTLESFEISPDGEHWTPLIPAPRVSLAEATRILAGAENIPTTQAECYILSFCHRRYLPRCMRPLAWSRYVSPRRAARRAHRRRMKRRG